MLQVLGTHGRSLPNTHPYKLNPLLTEWLTHLQKLGVAPSMRRTYQAGVNSYLMFSAAPSMVSNICLLHSSLFGTSAQNSVTQYHMLLLESTWQAFTSFTSRNISHADLDPITEAPLLHYLCNGIRRCTGDKKKTT